MLNLIIDETKEETGKITKTEEFNYDEDRAETTYKMTVDGGIISWYFTV